jgi:hypothetical protein
MSRPTRQILWIHNLRVKPMGGLVWGRPSTFGGKPAAPGFSGGRPRQPVYDDGKPG